MANKSFVVQYLIKARDGFSRDANSATRSSNALKKSIKQAGKASDVAAKQFKKSTDRLKRFKTEARSTGVTSRLTGEFKKLAVAASSFLAVGVFFRTGTAFQTALADLSAITGSTGEDLAFLREESLRLGVAMVTSQDKVATAFKIIASAKSELLLDPKGLSKVTEQVLILANAARIDLTDAANVTTQALNQFGAGADQAQRFVNVLAAGSKIGASEVAETGVAIIKVGAVAKAVGVSFEELNAAIQVLAKGGVKAEVAGTGLKTALLKMEKLSKKLRPSVVGLGQAFANLAEKGLDIAAMQDIFGAEAVVIGQILSENAQLTKDWTRALTGTSIAQQQAAVNTATFAKKMEKLKILVSGSLIRAFLRLEPVLSANADKLAAFLQTVKPEQVEAFADAMGVIANAVILVSKTVGALITQLSKVGKLLGETAGAVSTLDFGQFSVGTKERIKSVLLSISPSGVGSAARIGQQLLSVDTKDLVKGVLLSISPPGVEFGARIGQQLFSAPTAAPLTNNVNVGVQVGLDPGLTQTGIADVTGSGVRRTDVGVQ